MANLCKGFTLLQDNVGMSSTPTGTPPAARARPLMESAALAAQAAQCLRDNGGPAPWSPDDAEIGRAHV